LGVFGPVGYLQHVKINYGFLHLNSRHRQLVVAVLIVGLCLARFLYLETSPPGFSIDEAAGAAHVLCVQQTGKDCHNKAWPFFSAAAGGGVTTPTYLYFSVMWTSLFGTSPAAFRSVAAFFNVLTLLGLFLLAAHFMGNEFAGWVTLCGAILPWSFQFSRISWDPPLAVCFMMWGLVLLLTYRGRWSACGAGLFCALAMYSYPPTRLQVPLLLLGLCFFIRKRWVEVSWERLAISIGLLSLVCLPMAKAILFDDLQSRLGLVGIFSSYRDNPVAGKNGGVIFLEVIKNFGRHLSPSFLFISGDQSMRHSTGRFGVLSWLDLVAIPTFGGFLLYYRRSWKVHLTELQREKLHVIILFALMGIFSGILPAALTWESLPHSLRSIGAWPFFCLLSGTFLFVLIKSWRWFSTVSLLIALSFSSLYLVTYFSYYPRISANWFGSYILQTAREAQSTGDWETFEARVKNSPLAAQYFRRHYGAEKRPD
jgi:hypothetical protein